MLSALWWIVFNRLLITWRSTRTLLSTIGQTASMINILFLDFKTLVRIDNDLLCRSVILHIFILHVCRTWLRDSKPLLHLRHVASPSDQEMNGLELVGRMFNLALGHSFLDQVEMLHVVDVIAGLSLSATSCRHVGWICPKSWSDIINHYRS